MQEPGFIEYIGDFVVIIGHHNADLDAIGAAQGIKELIMKIKPDTITQIVMSEDISRLSENIIKKISSKGGIKWYFNDGIRLETLGRWKTQ